MHAVDADKELSKYKQGLLVPGDDLGEPYRVAGVWTVSER